jgi:hypothetical protein
MLFECGLNARHQTVNLSEAGMLPTDSFAIRASPYLILVGFPTEPKVMVEALNY